MQFRHTLIALIVPLTWGFGFAFAKAGLGYFSPLLLMSLRFLLAAGLLVCLVPFPRGHFWQLCGISFIAVTLQYGLTYSGLALMEATPAVLLVQSEVIFGVLIATIILSEKPNIRQLTGIVIALIGVVIILDAPALDGQMLGISLILSGSFVFVLGQVLIRRLDGALTGFQLTAWIGVMAGPQMLLASWILDGNPIPSILNAPIEAWATVIYLGVVMTAIGYSAWYFVLARYPVPVVMPILLLLPVAAIFAAVTFLGEAPDLMILIGGVVVIFGVGTVIAEPSYLINWWQRKKS